MQFDAVLVELVFDHIQVCDILNTPFQLKLINLTLLVSLLSNHHRPQDFFHLEQVSSLGVVVVLPVLDSPVELDSQVLEKLPDRLKTLLSLPVELVCLSTQDVLPSCQCQG